MKLSQEVVEVSISQLSEHSLQSQFSPAMTTKEWAKFLVNIREKGIHQPLTVTKGFKVIDGKHRLKAAHELGIENVTIIFSDIPENEIADYITDMKLMNGELKRGQKAALVINLYYEEERRKAKERQVASGEIYGISKEKVIPNLDEPIFEGTTNEALATKSGVGKSNIAYLIAVKKKRPDLFEKVFNGNYSINKAYTEMKRDEAPVTTEEERKAELDEHSAKIVKSISNAELGQAQFDESLPMSAPKNVAVSLRKTALSATATVLNNTKALKEVAEPEVKGSARKQLLTLAQSCIISLGQTTESENDAEILAVCLELLEKIEGGK